MRNRLAFLRFSYWLGAVFDGAMVVVLLFPTVGGAMLGIAGFRPGPDYRYATALAAALMAGWTALLVWSVFRPVERRGVLLLTAFPVVVGLAAAGVYAVAAGFVSLPYMLPIFAFQLTLIAIFVSAYVMAPSCAQGSANPTPASAPTG